VFPRGHQEGDMSTTHVTTQARTDLPETHMTAVTRLVDAAGVRFAYRRR
jgi:hypothetical protein